MFKSLLYTIPTLSGNVSISCALNQNRYNSSTNEYDSYVQAANLVPLQNDLIRQPILVNLLEGNWEYDIAKFYSIYETSFYEPNYDIYPNDYEKIDLLGVKPIDSRDKNYEFGCKRLNHHVQGYQFSFYAPFYIDNEKDVPDCFKIKLEFDNNITKTINIHIGDQRGNWNYLRNYITKYASKIDDNVIYLLPETNQCSCDGINVQYGGFAILKDDQIGQIYYNQMTINLFDNIITETFKRTKMMMKQVIPLAFMFNINDFLEGSEKRRLKDHTVKITGAYYKNGVKLPFYAFDNNYTNYKIHSYLFNKETHKDVNDNTLTEYIKTKQESQSLTSLPYPSLHEADYYRYKYTNKLNCMYCPWKLKYSSDTNPYIFNMTFAFKHYSQTDLISSNIYGEFPVFIDTLRPTAVFTPGKPTDLTISYINTYDEADDKLYMDENADIEKYYKIRNNHVCDWFTPYDENTIMNEENWTPVNNNKCYHKGILYNLSYFDPLNYFNENYTDERLAQINIEETPDTRLNKFGVFMNFDIENYDIDEMAYVKPTQYVINSSYNQTANAFAKISYNSGRDTIFNLTLANDDTVQDDSYVKVNIDSNVVLSYKGKLGEIFTKYVSDSGDGVGDHYTIPLKYETSYDLTTYYIDYSKVFNDVSQVDIVQESDFYGYLPLSITYTNIYRCMGDILEYDTDLYYSRNDLLEYEKLTDISYLNDSTTRYTFYARYPIQKSHNSKYAYVPICSTGDNIYGDAIVLNSSKLDKHIYVDEYDLQVFLESYNNIIYNTNYGSEVLGNYTLTSYARFTDTEHLQKWPKYISRDENDNAIYSLNNIFDNIYLRRRYITYNVETFDQYTPISYDISAGGLGIHTEREYQLFIKKLSKEDLYFTDGKNEYDIFFKKKFYGLTETLYDIIMQGCSKPDDVNDIIPLQLYVKNYNDINNITEEFEYLSASEPNYEEFITTLVDISDYLVPMFSSIYINDISKNDMLNIAFSGNILIDYADDDQSGPKYVFFSKFHNSCMISLDLYTQYNVIRNNNLNGINLDTDYYMIKEFINLSSHIIPEKLYELENVKDIKMEEISDTDKIITFFYTNDGVTWEKYGMYYININCSNTKYSFNFRDTSSMLFYTLEEKELTDNKLISKLIPYITSNIFSDFIGKRNTIIIPSTFVLKSKYIPIISQTENSINRYKHWTSYDNSENVYDIKFLEDSTSKIKLNRYTDYITPYIKEVNSTLYNRFNKIFKLSNKKFDERNIEGTNLNLYRHNNIRIGTDYDYVNHEPTIIDVDLIEYKHFNDNMLYNLEESFEVEVKDLLTYEDMLEKESFKNTFEIFKNRLTKYNSNISLDDKDKILFLYNRYNISYISVVKKLNSFKEKKLYKLIYKFTLI